ncbi:MAG: hypothetical protein ACM31F_07755, partial [Gemmatimonas sp.]
MAGIRRPGLLLRVSIRNVESRRTGTESRTGAGIESLAGTWADTVVAAHAITMGDQNAAQR